MSKFVFNIQKYLSPIGFLQRRMEFYLFEVAPHHYQTNKNELSQNTNYEQHAKIFVLGVLYYLDLMGMFGKHPILKTNAYNQKKRISIYIGKWDTSPSDSTKILLESPFSLIKSFNSFLVSK